MLNGAYQVERTAAASGARPAVAPIAGGAFAARRVWMSNPTVSVTAKRHDLTPVPRPEEAVSP